MFVFQQPYKNTPVHDGGLADQQTFNRFSELDCTFVSLQLSQTFIAFTEQLCIKLNSLKIKD